MCGSSQARGATTTGAMHPQPQCSAPSLSADESDSVPVPGTWAWAAFGREWNSPQQAEQEARRMFHRALAQWATDVLALRRRGLDRPGTPVRASAIVTPHLRAA